MSDSVEMTDRLSESVRKLTDVVMGIEDMLERVMGDVELLDQWRRALVEYDQNLLAISQSHEARLRRLEKTKWERFKDRVRGAKDQDQNTGSNSETGDSISG